MELRQLKYFLAVADELHFTRAARKLHVAQPALSQQIRQLEDEIGAKLLERTNRRVSLTEAGEVFRGRAAAAIDQLARAAVDAGQAGRGEAGSISIGFVSSAVCGALPAILRRFREKLPLVTFELRELEPSEQLTQIRQQHLDIGMMHAVLDEPNLQSVAISREKLIAALPEGHRLADQTSIDLHALKDETFLVPRRHAAIGFHELVVTACREKGFDPIRIQPTRLLQTAVALVGGGIGIALVPESFQRNLQIRGVIYKRLTSYAPVAELVAVWRKDDDHALVRKFQRELKTMLREQAFEA